MADKPAPKADDGYSEEETAKRRDATIRAMIGMKPQPHAKGSGWGSKQVPQPKRQIAEPKRKG